MIDMRINGQHGQTGKMNLNSEKFEIHLPDHTVKKEHAIEQYYCSNGDYSTINHRFVLRKATEKEHEKNRIIYFVDVMLNIRQNLMDISGCMCTNRGETIMGETNLNFTYTFLSSANLPKFEGATEPLTATMTIGTPVMRIS